MFHEAAFRGHVARWDRLLNRRPMRWWDRWSVRRALARRYRALGLPKPAYAFVSSPVAAAIVAGIATGVRWLQRHPDSHAALFGKRLESSDLAAAIEDAVDRARADLDPKPDRGGIIAAIRSVCGTVPVALPYFARVVARPVETVAAAPELAANDGHVHYRVLVEPIERVCEHVEAIAYPHSPPQIRVVVRQAVDHFLRTFAPDTATFLTQTLASWLNARGSDEDLLAGTIVAAFAHRNDISAGARDAIRVVRNAGFVATHADFWVASDRPSQVICDEQRRLHHTEGPAVSWRDGFGIAFLHGVPVDLRLLHEIPTLQDVLNTRNAEVRRRLIELYERGDPGRFIRDADADVVEFDFDKLGNKRRLLRIALMGDEAYVAVEVTNSTPEPDGTHKHYILRVPPTITTCRAAVAWTFGMSERDYDPDTET